MNKFDQVLEILQNKIDETYDTILSVSDDIIDLQTDPNPNPEIVENLIAKKNKLGVKLDTLKNFFKVTKAVEEKPTMRR